MSIILYVISWWRVSRALLGPGVSTNTNFIPTVSTKGILPLSSILKIFSSLLSLFISSRVTFSIFSIISLLLLYATAEKWSCSVSTILTIVAVVASLAVGISFLPNKALIKVDLPELIVATTLTSNSAFLAFSKASIILLLRNSGIVPF